MNYNSSTTTPFFVSSATTPLSGTAWWVAFAFTFTAAVVFAVLSYIRNVKPEARLVRFFFFFFFFCLFPCTRPYKKTFLPPLPPYTHTEHLRSTTS